MRVGIFGFGKLGGALLELCNKSAEFSEVLLFSHRERNEEGRALGSARIYPTKILKEKSPSLDLLLLAHSSKGEILSERIALQRRYTTVDAFDVHGVLEDRRCEIDATARQNKTVGIVGIGWDPGVLSLARSLCFGIFGEDGCSTRWGVGVSEGHSSAIRALQGVQKAIQYTVPTENGHRRVCYVVCEKSQEMRIAHQIKSIPEYFLPYETEVHFISLDEFDRVHEGARYHRGSVFGNGDIAGEASLSLEVKMQSNPHFTAAIMLAYARAARSLMDEKAFGAYGPLDIPLRLLVGGRRNLW